MNLSAQLDDLDLVMNGLKDFGDSLASPAADAAATALASTLVQARGEYGLSAPLQQTSEGSRRLIGASDVESISREFGTLETDASPWLAPSLPAALGPMRAAVVTAVARAISAFRPNIR